MSKVYFKRLLSLALVLLLVLPTLVSASSGTSITIKSVYFQDESGNMVFVDYKGAIDQSMVDDLILYNAIKYHVGVTELKGRPLFLETNTGKILDYGKAMRDNLFRLEDIINNAKYEVRGPIAYTHELKVVDGVAKIVPIPVVEPLEIVSITPVNDITVEFGTSLESAIGQLRSTTTITDNKGETHTVVLNWAINNYDGNVAGRYNATGTFNLPSGMNNSAELRLLVDATVTVTPLVVEDWPIQVENVFVGISQITGSTYANIDIKVDYVSVVTGVYVDGILAQQLENHPSQWRIIVEENTTVEDLRGRIIVKPEVPVIVKDFDVKIDKEQYNINEEVRLTGVVSKEGIELGNIDITLKIEGNEGVIVVEQLITSSDGKFSYVFMMPENSSEGQYKITIKGQEPLNETVELNFRLTK